MQHFGNQNRWVKVSEGWEEEREKLLQISFLCFSLSLISAAIQMKPVNRGFFYSGFS